MIKLFRWLLGYVVFSFSNGFVSGFVDECYQNKINIHDVKNTPKGIVAICSSSEYKKLHTIAHHNGGIVKIERKRGLLFPFLAIQKRAGLLAGALAFVVIINTLTGFVWNIDVVGNNRIKTEQIKSFFAQNGLHEGVHWHSFDHDQLENLMMASFDDCAWVHINRFGTTARIEINEATLKPDIDDNNGYANLISNRDGIVVKIDIRRGWKVVNVGDAVTKGDLLVSGVFESEIAKRNVFSKATGRVIARVVEPINITVSRTQKHRVFTDKKTYKMLYFFGLKLGISGRKGCANTTDYSYLRLNGKNLPIGIATTVSQKYVDSDYVLNDNELNELVNKELEERLKNDFSDAEIEKQNIKISLDFDSGNAVGTVVVLENIAEQIKFY